MLTVLEDDGARLRGEYGEVRRDAYGLGRDTYDVTAEVHDLRDGRDFVDRVRQRGSGQVTLDLPRLAGDPLYALVFVDPPGSPASTLVLHCAATSAGEASPVARILGRGPAYEAEREGALTLLERLAASIGADYFFSGPELLDWRRAPIERLLAGPDDDFQPALVAWRAGLFAQRALTRAWGVDPRQVRRGAAGFERIWL